MRSEVAVAERRARGLMQVHRATYRYAPRGLRPLDAYDNITGSVLLQQVDAKGDSFYTFVKPFILR